MIMISMFDPGLANFLPGSQIEDGYLLLPSLMKTLIIESTQKDQRAFAIAVIVFSLRTIFIFSIMVHLHYLEQGREPNKNLSSFQKPNLIAWWFMVIPNSPLLWNLYKKMKMVPGLPINNSEVFSTKVHWKLSSFKQNKKYIAGIWMAALLNSWVHSYDYYSWMS